MSFRYHSNVVPLSFWCRSVLVPMSLRRTRSDGIFFFWNDPKKENISRWRVVSLKTTRNDDRSSFGGIAVVPMSSPCRSGVAPSPETWRVPVVPISFRYHSYVVLLSFRCCDGRTRNRRRLSLQGRFISGTKGNDRRPSPTSSFWCRSVVVLLTFCRRSWNDPATANIPRCGVVLFQNDRKLLWNGKNGPRRPGNGLKWTLNCKQSGMVCDSLSRQHGPLYTRLLSLSLVMA